MVLIMKPFEKTPLFDISKTHFPNREPDPRTRWHVALQHTTATFKELFGYIISNSKMILYSSRLKLLRPPAVPLHLSTT